MKVSRAVTLGRRAGRLNLELETGSQFVDALQLQAGRDDPEQVPEGTPLDWPDGTESWIVVTNKSSGTSQKWSAIVLQSWLRWQVQADLVDLVSREAWSELWIKYDGAEPILWAEGPVSWT
ncbi:tail fiber [Gordonia phage Soos]|nr:tail fiber [Gordonia phage Soos]